MSYMQKQEMASTTICKKKLSMTEFALECNRDPFCVAVNMAGTGVVFANIQIFQFSKIGIFCCKVVVERGLKKESFGSPRLAE